MRLGDARRISNELRKLSLSRARARARERQSLSLDTMCRGEISRACNRDRYYIKKLIKHGLYAMQRVTVYGLNHYDRVAGDND
jgi:Cys-tRNA synthase (O-phospho-L-seryl-tRNA:Cys-tRNA synthase)